ncbi:hypothetical protein [Gottfriedia acidiceleris]|uniref:hypothetical protein n=1 Tax=Gottfriedia acidiceleris TaxID=371036 RepID=UPI00101B6892|nr:hypothetical protein [Gottfriedia acidiceleris]
MDLDKLMDKGIIAVNKTIEDLWNSEFVNQLIEIDDSRKVVEVGEYFTYFILEKAKDVGIEIEKENV